MKNFNQFQEAAALAIPAAGLVSKFILPAAATTATIIGGVGTYLQSRKKKEKEEDLLGTVRKKQDEIQQDVANKETLEKNKDFQNKEKSRGKYVIRKPENQFNSYNPLKEQMTTCSTAGKPGFSNAADDEGSVAGRDPLMFAKPMKRKLGPWIKAAIKQDKKKKKKKNK